MPKRPKRKILGIVAPDTRAAEGVDHGAIRTYTLWGELALGLGGAASYHEIRESEEKQIPLGANLRRSS